jgi:hypothetical protein
MSFLIYFDQSSITPQFYINGNERYVTQTGGFLTIVGMVTSLVLAAYFIFTFFERDSLNVVYSLETNEVKPSMNFTDFFMFTTYDLSTGLPADPRAVTLTPVLWHLINGLDESVDILPTKTCTNTTFTENYNEMFSSFNIAYEDYHCLDNSKGHNLTLYTDMSVANNRYMLIYISRCQNSTENGNHCYADEEINSKLKEMSLFYWAFYPVNTYDHGLLEHPITQKAGFDNYPFDPYFLKTRYITFKSLIYESDSALIFDDYIPHYGITYDEINSYDEYSGPETKVRIPKTFGNVIYNFNGVSADKYRRQYPKLQALIANITGIMNLLMMICGVIAEYISRQMMYIDLSNIIIKHVDASDKNLWNRTPRPKAKDSSLKTVKPVTEMTAGGNESFKKEKRSHLIKRISIVESLLCSCCTKLNSSKRILDNTSLIMRKHMSIDYLLRLLSEFERMKKIMMTDDQQRVFEHLNNPTIEEYIKSMTIQIKEIMPNREKIIPPIRSNDEITQRMQKML